MSLLLEIPESVIQAMRLPEKRLREELLLELAVALYYQEALSFGSARELCNLTKQEFGSLLGKRNIVRHYGPEELMDDLAYANRQ
jgi:predicted HTH domain antitoxin